jgi:molybdopterin/thiamine biosynthesis adenylyltransferase
LIGEGYPNSPRSQQEFARQELLWGSDGQAILGRSEVVVVGAGGTGTHVIAQLAHLGVGRLTVIDLDRIEQSNLSRLIGATPSDVGEPKVSIAERMVHSIRSSTLVTSINDSVLAIDTECLIKADAIVCCTDSHGSRALLNELAYQYLIPLVEMGIEVQTDGHGSRAGGGVRLVGPERPCLQCMQIVDSALVRRDFLSDDDLQEEVARGYVNGHAIEAPSVVSLNGVIASLAVLEVCSILVGLFPVVADRLVYRAERRSVSAVGTARDENCYVCGLNGLLGMGDARALPRRWNKPPSKSCLGYAATSD